MNVPLAATDSAHKGHDGVPNRACTDKKQKEKRKLVNLSPSSTASTVPEM